MSSHRDDSTTRLQAGVNRPGRQDNEEIQFGGMEMSRSRRKTAIIGAPSDKPFKVDEHRAERHALRAVVQALALVLML
jgi:hypothetical protein